MKVCIGFLDLDCPAPINSLHIISPIVGGILLAGIIGLALWKLWQTQRDKRKRKKIDEAKNRREIQMSTIEKNRWEKNN